MSEAYFNSIMVQLKRTIERQGVNVVNYFNSIMVQLKLLGDIFRDHIYYDFNSIMVQLKRESLFSLMISPYEFQFHNGTIKTEDKIRFCLITPYFNSIMVQLKPIGIYNGNLVFTEVSLRINVYFFAVKMSMYNESIFADLRQHLHLIFIVKG